MKGILYLLFIVPVFCFGQYDFETRYFKIDAEALPAMPDITSYNLDYTATAKFEKKNLSDFNKVTPKNYWEAVDMTGALSQVMGYEEKGFDVEQIQSQFSNYNQATYSSDGATRVTNTVYKEQRGLDFLDPCPPFGVCGRCAPFRAGGFNRSN